MKLVRLGDLCEIRIGRTPDRSNPAYWGGSIPWATISDLSAPVLERTRQGVTTLAVQDCRLRTVKSGTLLYSFKLTIGKMAFAGVDLFTNEAIAALVPHDPRIVDTSYLRLALMTIDGATTASHAVKGRTLNSRSLSELLVPVAPIHEQRRIASQLADQFAALDAARLGVERQANETRSLRVSAARKTFGEAALNWPTSPLGAVLALRNDIVHPRSSPTGEAVFVGLEHIESGTGIRVGAAHIRLDDLTGRKARFQPGDIVYGYLRPYLNKVWSADFAGLCSVDQYVFTVDPSLADRGYVAAFMRSPLYLETAPIHVTPGQLPRIRTDEVLGVQMPLPPLVEQRRIVRHLDEETAAIDMIGQAVETGLNALKALRPVLLRRAFDSDSARNGTHSASQVEGFS